MLKCASTRDQSRHREVNMTGRIVNGLTELKIEDAVDDPLTNSLAVDECEEAFTTDSEEYLSEPLRYHRFQYSTSTDMSTDTLKPDNVTFYSCNNGNVDNVLQIPIVGYEIMEERARFTVFKLRVENKSTGDCWYVFRRYMDFVRLCNKLKEVRPKIFQYLPRKRWIGNNFDPIFLEDRVNKLQSLVNFMLSDLDLANCPELQEFFCLTEPPMYSESSEESRAMFEGLEETIYHLKQQIMEKEQIIDNLHDALREKTIENENLKKQPREQTCFKCQKDLENNIETKTT